MPERDDGVLIPLPSEPATSSVQPLFVADLPTLKAKLRLGSATNPDTLAVIEDVCERVRLNLIQRLGNGTVTRIRSYPYSLNPLNDNEIERAKANQAETLWCRLLLLRQLPTLFMAAGASSLENWNEEGLTRQNPSEKEIGRLEVELEALLADLAGTGDGEGSLIRGGAIEAERPDRIEHVSVLGE